MHVLAVFLDQSALLMINNLVHFVLGGAFQDAQVAEMIEQYLGVKKKRSACSVLIEEVDRDNPNYLRSLQPLCVRRGVTRAKHCRSGNRRQE